jgi:hypothetical protein
MVQRCTNPRSKDYPRYGGRGITVCDRWLDVELFFEDMGPRPGLEYTLHRIDNDKGYFPGNVKWATAKEHAQNKRGTKLDQIKANQIRELHKIGMKRAQLAYLFNVSPLTISDIYLYKTWRP